MINCPFCLYAADYHNNRVQVFSPSGNYFRSFGRLGNGLGELYQPHSIHVHNDYVYITDYGNDRVSVFTKCGLFVSSFDVYRKTRRSSRLALVILMCMY